MEYYRYMAVGPSPSVAVIEDLDDPDCVGAFWGEVNTTLHKGLGIAGALTNGVMRDLGDLPVGFPVVAGSIGASHGFVHVVNFDEPASVFGLDIPPGALIHADRHGAVRIPEVVIPHSAMRKYPCTSTVSPAAGSTMGCSHKVVASKTSVAEISLKEPQIRTIAAPAVE